jgi:anhydro-N-acetylmuramic acid kinase
MSFLPPWPSKEQEQAEKSGKAKELVPLGLDPGLGVFFIDLMVRRIDPSLEYDDEGKMARSGKVHHALLSEFQTYRYYQQESLPIGVGVEDFPETLFQKWVSRGKELGVSDVDILASLVELTCWQIARAAAKYGGSTIANGATDDILVRGGVLKNKYFMERLQAQFSEQLKTEIKKIKTLEELGLDEDAWENAQYAMMGYLCFNNIYNFVPSCTGASRPVVGGKIAPGENFHEIALKNLQS